MTQIKVLKVFLASPGDVLAERLQVRTIIEEINRGIGRDKGLRLDVIGWETDSYPAYGSDPQSIVNSQIADMPTYDLFIGIMWNRFGQPTPRAESGTEEEFESAAASFRKHGRPHIMFYFSQALSSLNTAAEVEQRGKVLQFKQKIQRDGLIGGYASVDQFSVMLRDHLTQWVFSKTIEIPETSAIQNDLATNSVQEPDFISETGMWVLLKANYFLAENVEEHNDSEIILSLPSRDAEEDAYLRGLRATLNPSREPIPFAYQNSAGIANVISAERLSQTGRTIWRIKLKMRPIPRGLGVDTAYNSISADEIAIMRARLILLDERPVIGERGRDDLFLQAIVAGINVPVTVMQSLLPALWAHFNGDARQFLPFARLWAVFHLIGSNTCEHILELVVGPIQNDKLHVKFRGRRYKTFANEEAVDIAVEGDCDLSSKGV